METVSTVHQSVVQFDIFENWTEPVLDSPELELLVKQHMQCWRWYIHVILKKTCELDEICVAETCFTLTDDRPSLVCTIRATYHPDPFAPHDPHTILIASIQESQQRTANRFIQLR